MSTQTVQISTSLQQRVFAQLQGNYPNEGGGFLLGARTVDQVTLTEIRPVVNTFASDEQFHRYAMTPSAWAKLEDEADAAGLIVVTMVEVSLFGLLSGEPETVAVLVTVPATVPITLSVTWALAPG